MWAKVKTRFMIRNKHTQATDAIRDKRKLSTCAQTLFNAIPTRWTRGFWCRYSIFERRRNLKNLVLYGRKCPFGAVFLSRWLLSDSGWSLWTSCGLWVSDKAQVIHSISLRKIIIAYLTPSTAPCQLLSSKDERTGSQHHHLPYPYYIAILLRPANEQQHLPPPASLSWPAYRILWI